MKKIFILLLTLSALFSDAQPIAWLQSGNVGADGRNFGTTNNRGWPIIANGVKVGYIDSLGRFALGVTNPTTDLFISKAATSCEVQLVSGLNTGHTTIYQNNNVAKGLRLQTFGSTATGTYFGGLVNRAASSNIRINDNSYPLVLGGLLDQPIYIGSGTSLTASFNTTTQRLGIGVLTPLAGFHNATNSASGVPSNFNSGTWFAGTTPHFLISPTGTTFTGNTNGTGLAISAPAGFTGRYIELETNGTRNGYWDADDLTLDPSGVGSGALTAGFDGGLKLSGGILTIVRGSYGSKLGAIYTGVGSSTGDYNAGHVFTVTSAFTTTSVNTFNVQAVAGFAPTSGTAEFTGYHFNSTLNQTGGANGITRGFYANPTLTAAANYRGFETSNNTGYAFKASGTAQSAFGGAVSITGTTTLATSLTGILQASSGVVSTTTASGINAEGINRSQAQLDATTTTLTDIPNLTYTVTAGVTYVFKAKLFVDADVVGGQKYAIGGTATATSIKYQINTLSNTANTYVITSRQTAIGGSAGQAGSTSNYTEINGTITVNTGGTLTVQFAENAASGTSSCLTLSSFEVKQSN